MNILLLVSCAFSLLGSAVAATRTAGLTTPGTAVPPEGGLLRLGAADNLAANEDYLSSVVSDPASGYAWFGAGTSPGQVIKLAFTGTTNAPRRVGSVVLPAGEDALFTGVIDTNAGYAYFGTFTSPGRVIKVTLGSSNEPPARIGAVTLNFGEEQLFCSVIDPASGYAYFGTRTTPGRVVKIALGTGNSAPMRVGSTTLAAGENLLRTAMIDPAAGYAWFGTFSDPARIVKVALGAGSTPPSRVGAVTLGSGENRLTAGVIDLAAGHAWFATRTTPGKVVKIALGSGNAAPARLGAVTLNPGEDFLSCAATSAALPGYAFFGCDTFPGTVVKIGLGTGGDPPTRISAATMGSGEDSLVSAADVGGTLLFGCNTQPGQVIQVGSGTGSQPPARQSALALGRGENDLQSAVIDAANGYGWFGTATFPGQVIKVRLGHSGEPPRRISALTLEPGEDRLTSVVADLAAGYAWFGTDTGPGRVVKVALGSGDNPPLRVGAVTLNSDERFLRSAVIDVTNRYAYFGTGVIAPGKVVKIALGTGSSSPTRIGAATFNANEWDFQSAVIDGPGTYALFGTGQYLAETGAGGKVVKVALGTGASPPARAGVLTLPTGEEVLHAAVSDPLSSYAWFGGAMGLTQGLAIKVAFETGNAPPRRVGAALFRTNEAPLAAAVIDVPAGYALFAGKRHVVKVDLGNGEAPPVRVGGIELLPEENSIHCAAADPSHGLAWFGTSTQPGNVVLLSYSQQGFIKGTRVDLGESGTLTALNFFSHTANGRLRLALYAHNGINRDLLWQSGVISNSAAGSWVTIPVNQGTPPTLQLTAGTYALAWQVDTTTDVPSYVPGAFPQGFRVPATFGPFPSVLTENSNNWVTTSETWASHLAYEIPVPTFLSIRRTNDTVTLVWSSNPGTYYQVQQCTNLPPPAWDDIGAPVQATGTNTGWSQTGVTGIPIRFYRLTLP